MKVYEKERESEGESVGEVVLVGPFIACLASLCVAAAMFYSVYVPMEINDECLVHAFIKERARNESLND